MATAAGVSVPASAPGAAVIVDSGVTGVVSDNVVERRSSHIQTSTDNSEICDGAESENEIAEARYHATVSAAAVPPLRLSDLEPRDLNILFK